MTPNGVFNAFWLSGMQMKIKHLRTIKKTFFVCVCVSSRTPAGETRGLAELQFLKTNGFYFSIISIKLIYYYLFIYLRYSYLN